MTTGESAITPQTGGFVPKLNLGMFFGVRTVSILATVLFCVGIDFFSGPQFMSRYAAGLIFLCGTYVALSVSLNLINGITGQFSIGHFAFFQIGAYTAAGCSKAFYATMHLPTLEWLVLMAIAGSITAAIAGFVVGLPSLRLRGDYLAIVTLGFGEIIRIATENITYLGGSKGIDITPHYQSIALIMLLAVGCIALSRNLLKTAFGLGFLAVREDEVAAVAMGVNVTRIKVLAFIIGSAFAGAAGALYAHKYGFIIPDQFKMDGSFIVLTMVILGGTGSVTGSILAAIILTLLPELLRDLHNVSFGGLIATALMVLVATFGIKRVIDTHFDLLKMKWLSALGVLAACVIGEIIIKMLLDLFPHVRTHAPIDGAQLRMVIYAATLVIVMLLRPQGMFAHHEFSWTWVKKVLHSKTAVKS